MDSAQVKEKEDKIAFLDKMVALLGRHLNTLIDIRSSKVVSGMDADKTNSFLQHLAIAATHLPDSSSSVAHVLEEMGGGGGGGGKRGEPAMEEEEEDDVGVEVDVGKEEERERVSVDVMEEEEDIKGVREAIEKSGMVAPPPSPRGEEKEEVRLFLFE